MNYNLKIKKLANFLLSLGQKKEFFDLLKIADTKSILELKSLIGIPDDASGEDIILIIKRINRLLKEYSVVSAGIDDEWSQERQSALIKLIKENDINITGDFEDFISKLSQKLNEKKYTLDVGLKGKIINLLPGKKLKLREGPTPLSSVLTRIDSNTEIYYLGKTAEFMGFTFANISAKVSEEGVNGWIPTNFIEYYKPDGTLVFRGKEPEENLTEKSKQSAPSSSTEMRSDTSSFSSSEKKEYYKILFPKEAKRIRETYNVPEAVTLAQARIESKLGEKDINGFNFFGIKGKGTAGSTSAKTGEEYTPGQKVQINADFQKHNRPEDSFDAYGKLLSTSDRYKLATQKYADDPANFAIYIWSGAYATSSRYPLSLEAASKTNASEFNDPNLAFSYTNEQRKIIDRLAAARPEDRKKMLEQMTNLVA